jgi:alpha-L-fucosidase
MKVNGEAIYGTRMYRVFKDGDDIRFTQSKDGKTTFIFLFEFPPGKVTLSKMKFTRATHIQMLGSSTRLSWKNVGGNVEFSLPAKLKAASNHVWVVRATER